MKHIYLLNYYEAAEITMKPIKGLRISLSSCLYLMLFCSATFAAKYTTKQNGNWTTNSTWENNTPPPLVGGGSSAMYTDSIIVKHKINIGNNVIRIADYLEVITPGRIYSGNANNGLVILSDAVAINRDSIDLGNIQVDGDMYNYNYLKSRDLTISDSGYLFIGSDGYVQTLQPANNRGVIYNMGILYSPSNFINNNGTITGDGGTYLVDGNLTNNAGALATCANNPINICRMDGTDPTVNGSGTIDSGCVLICGVPLNSGLPVKLISFSGRINERNEAQLSWITAVEINNNFFEVQKSYDAIDWQIIDTVFSKVVNSSIVQHYEYIDKPESNQGKTVYYRLRQVDTDGRFEFLPVIYLSITVKEEFIVEAYPNPASTNIYVKISSASSKSDGTIYLTDLFGRIVFSKKIKTELQEVNINTEEIPSGLYYLIVQHDESEIANKIMLKH
jgi:hypothetical protein